MAGAILRTLFAPDTTHIMVIVKEPAPADTAGDLHGD